MKARKILTSLLVMVSLMGLVATATSQQGAVEAEGPETPLAAMGTAFTYQGELQDGEGPVNGACDLRFRLWDAAEDGAQVASEVILAEVDLVDGRFTAMVDFGAQAFHGDARWLAFAARCPAGSGEYTILEPRQALTPVSSSLYAAQAPWSGLSGVPVGLGDGDDDTLAALDCTNGQIAEWNGAAWICSNGEIGTGFWSLSGNAGTTAGANYVGTSDNKALVLKVNGARALRLEPASSPNLVGGFGGNQVTAGAVGATISGGGSEGSVQKVTDRHGTIGGGGRNQAGDGAGTQEDAGYATVGGGSYNIASGGWSAIGGGFYNESSAWYATVAGGAGNAAGGEGAAVGGGVGNQATAYCATVSGGGRTEQEDPETANHATEQFATIGGGGDNVASAHGATASGGLSNEATSQYATIGGGLQNATSGGWAATIGGGQQNVAVGGATVGGGLYNEALAGNTSIAGGYSNHAFDRDATVSGGSGNTAGSENSDPEDASYATVGGGLSNDATDWGATVAGGVTNEASEAFSTVAGGFENVASGASSTIGGGRGNTASGDSSTIAGGGPKAWDDPTPGNLATDNYCAVGGGAENVAGNNNTNKTDAEFATVGGGNMNVADGRQATVGGGGDNRAGYRATVSGGLRNEASGSYSAIPGGLDNLASGNYSFAGGRHAWASNPGSFVWADSTEEVYSDGGSNQFRVRANGGVYLTLDTEGEDWWTCHVHGGSSWACTSDRNQKEDLVVADGREVLDQLEEVPIYYWRGIGQETRHLGPMAQDFWAAYEIGDGDTSLSTIDLDGVALAAIQGLYTLVQEQEEQIEDLEARMAAMEAALAAMATEGSGSGP